MKFSRRTALFHKGLLPRFSLRRFDSFAIPAVVVCLITSATGAGAQTVSTWNGSTGNWSDAARWSTNPFYPDNGNGAPSYSAVIGGGSVTLDVNVALAGLSLGGGALGGAGDLAADSVTLTSGTLGTSGAFNSPQVALNGGILARNLTLSAGSHSLQNAAIGAGFTLTNPAGSTLTALTGPGEKEALGPGSLANQGTFAKTGPVRFYASLPVNNDGLVQVQQNNLRLGGGGTHTGQFDLWTGSQLELTGTHTFAAGATISGAGGVRILGGTSTINSEVATDFVWLSGGTLAGSGNLHPGRFDLEGGVLARNLTLPAANNTIGNLAIGAGSTLTNPVGSTLTATAGPGEKEGFGDTLINQGTFVKNGNARYHASMHMNNDGLVRVQQSALRIGGGGGTHTGQFDVWTGAQLEINGPHEFAASAVISGAGSVRIMGSVATINGSVTTSSLWASGGTVAGEGTIAAPSLFSPGSKLSPGVAAGTLSFDADLTMQNGSTLAWQLAALSTANPGVDWDRVLMTDGQLSLAAGTVLGLEFIDAASSPAAGNPFWSGPRRWNNILNLTGTATNPSGFVDLAINNSHWAQLGEFDTVAAQSGSGIDLVWNPVPEPESILLALFGAAGFLALRKRVRVDTAR